MPHPKVVRTFGGSRMPLTLRCSEARSVTTRPWEMVAASQPAADDDDAITADNFTEADEYDVFAMNDRNSFAQEWPNRRIFVVLGDGCVHIFNEQGVAINEPGEGVIEGRQDLDGDSGFLADWTSDYYRLPVEAEEPAVLGGHAAEAVLLMGLSGAAALSKAALSKAAARQRRRRRLSWQTPATLAQHAGPVPTRTTYCTDPAAPLGRRRLVAAADGVARRGKGGPTNPAPSRWLGPVFTPPFAGGVNRSSPNAVAPEPGADARAGLCWVR